MEPRNPRLDRYVFSLTGKAKPRVCFRGDRQRGFGTLHPQILSHDEKAPLRAFASFALPTRCATRRSSFSQDVIYVGGGNTFNLLHIWRAHGVDRAMREAWKRGIIFCGVSAGMICWFDCSVTDSFGAFNKLDDGMGFLPGSACPHYDGEAATTDISPFDQKRIPRRNRRRQWCGRSLHRDQIASVHCVAKGIVRVSRRTRGKQSRRNAIGHGSA